MAEAPVILTEGAVIYLADNLDEKDKLGWCIDTEGRGFAEQFQAHSCKPKGGDTQFSFDAATGVIQSVAFDGKCMTLSDPDNQALPFGLLDCEQDEPAQQFAYDAETMQFKIAGDDTHFVAVAPISIAAGPFMSRDLILASCADTDPSIMQWVSRD
ncbi:MAG: ricin-type beta-trefoil lectin domain protein [Geminicoccales bacterium]